MSKKATVQPQVKKFKLSEIHPAKYNPRTISDDALAGLAASIQKFGCVESIIVNTRDSANTIVGGNQRFKVLQAAGAKEAICITVDLNEADEKVLNLTLNNPHVQGEFIKNLGGYIDEIRGDLSNEVYINLKIGELRESIAGPYEARGYLLRAVLRIGFADYGGGKARKALLRNGAGAGFLRRCSETLGRMDRKEGETG